MFAKLFYVIVFVAFLIGFMTSRRAKKCETNRWDMSLLVICLVMTAILCLGNFRLSFKHSKFGTRPSTYPDMVLKEMVSWWSTSNKNRFVRPKFIDENEGMDETRYVLAGMGCMTAFICGWATGMYSRTETKTSD